MLAVSCREYYVPYRFQGFWFLQRRNSEEVTKVNCFKYTLLPDKVEGMSDYEAFGNERITFEFNDASVKPSMRSIRKYGSELCRILASWLSKERYHEGYKPKTGLEFLSAASDLDCWELSYEPSSNREELVESHRSWMECKRQPRK